MSKKTLLTKRNTKHIKNSFSNRVRPICLPLGAKFPDSGGHRGFVAGWGHVRNKECHTDAQGPSPYTQCAFPFMHRNKTYNQCSTDPTPSADDPVCVAYEKATGSTLLSGDPSAHVEITSKATGGKITECYAKQAGPAGKA